MTVLWGALIVAGLVMVLIALWPSIRERKRPGDSDQEGF
jgi:hypothetical protein